MKKVEINLMDSVPYVRFVSWYVAESRLKFHVPWRVIYDFEIIYITEGEMAVEERRADGGREKYLLKKYDFHVMEPLVWHTRYIEEGKTCTYYTVHFDFLADKRSKDIDVGKVYLAPCNERVEVSDIDGELSRREVYRIKDIALKRVFRVRDATRMEISFERLFRLFHRNDEVLDFQLRGNFIALLGILFEEMRDESGVLCIADAIGRFKHYVCEYISSSVSVEKFARDCGFSPVYFRREFKKRENVAPGEFVVRERLALAKKLLSDGKKVTDVSSMVGYCDVCYFSRTFKKRFGKSPAAYAKEARERRTAT